MIKTYHEAHTTCCYILCRIISKINTLCCALLDYKLINHLTPSKFTLHISGLPTTRHTKCCQIHQLHGLARPAAVSSKTLTPGHEVCRLVLGNNFKDAPKVWSPQGTVCSIMYLCIYIYMCVCCIRRMTITLPGNWWLLSNLDSRQNTHPISHLLLNLFIQQKPDDSSKALMRAALAICNSQLGTAASWSKPAATRGDPWNLQWCLKDTFPQQPHTASFLDVFWDGPKFTKLYTPTKK